MKSKTNKVILAGAFHEMIELCELNGYEIIAIFDNIKKGIYKDYQIVGTDNDAKGLFKKYGESPVIISPDDPEKRLKIADIFLRAGYGFFNLVSKEAFISGSAVIKKGVTVQSMVNISSNVILKDFVKVNTMANIMHDTTVDDYSTIAPNAVLLGNTRVGRLSYIGANATILPGITVGNNVMVGAGSVVTRDVEDGLIVAGNPAKELRPK